MAEYYGHCPKCGVLLGFGHLPEKCTGRKPFDWHEPLRSALAACHLACADAIRAIDAEIEAEKIK